MNGSAISWLGEFSYDRAGNQSLHGQIKYSPEQGIILHFFKSIISPWSPPDFLRGILETGEECALISPINLPGLEPIQYISHKDSSNVVKGEIGYQFLVLGKHAGLEELVDEISFSFSGLASFATGKDRHCQFTRGPMIYSKQTKMGMLSIWRADSGVCTLSLKDDYFVLESEVKAFDTLANEFETKASEQNIHPLKRTSAQYNLVLKLDAPTPLGEAYASIQLLVSLFSFLLYSPTQEDSVIARQTPSYDRSLRIYRSSSLDEKTLAIINSFKPLQDIPISINDIELDIALDKWISESPKYITLLSGIQTRTGVKAIHEIYADLVIICAFMGTIAHQEVCLRDKHKYEDVIRKYACSGLQLKILGTFEVSDLCESGKAISELRAEIVHFKGDYKWLDIMSYEKLCHLAQLLELTVIGYIFGKLGIKKAVTEKYQTYHSTTFWTSV